MRIGVTGGTGFIGSYLLKDYSSQYQFVVATSRDDLCGLPGVEYKKTDYSKESFKEIFQNCDGIIHLGGHVQHGAEKQINVGPYLVNIEVADALLSAAHELGISNIVNASSVAVYRHIVGRATIEDDICEPGSVYGMIKLSIEKLAGIYNRRYNMKIKSLRFGQGIGKVANLDDSRFWAVLQKNCLAGRAIPIWGTGDIGRDIIYVRDMASAAIAAIKSADASGVYNIGSGVCTTNLEIAKAYCKIFDNQAGIQFVHTDNSTSEHAWLDCTKANLELGFTPAYDLTSMVQDIFSEFHS